jgi:hypothetical protein
MTPRTLAIEINLTSVIMVMQGDEPMVYASAFDAAGSPGLPSGPFDPVQHRTLELGLRSFTAVQAGLEFGYVEQLYTFADRGRHAGEALREEAGADKPHVVSIGYLALTRIAAGAAPKAHFHDLYRFFPWEDWRGGRPAIIEADILPRLDNWARDADPVGEGTRRLGLTRQDRVAMLFGTEGQTFDEEKVLERYELLYEAGLADEALRDGRRAADRWSTRPALGRMMQFDHRRIVATALGRIRAKLKYRPVIFELMPPAFTLTDLQKKVEAISGHHLHKQNFRRLVETGRLVEPTGAQTVTGGRPAALFRFRHDVLTERPAPGLRLGRGG